MTPPRLQEPVSISQHDVLEARDAWRKDAPATFKNLLDAVAEAPNPQATRADEEIRG